MQPPARSATVRCGLLCMRGGDCLAGSFVALGMPLGFYGLRFRSVARHYCVFHKRGVGKCKEPPGRCASPGCGMNGCSRAVPFAVS